MEWTQDVDMDIDIYVPKIQVGSNWQVLLYKSMEILNPYMEYGKILFLESQEFRGSQCQFWRKCGSNKFLWNSVDTLLNISDWWTWPKWPDKWSKKLSTQTHSEGTGYWLMWVQYSTYYPLQKKGVHRSGILWFRKSCICFWIIIIIIIDRLFPQPSTFTIWHIVMLIKYNIIKQGKML